MRSRAWLVALALLGAGCRKPLPPTPEAGSTSATSTSATSTSATSTSATSTSATSASATSASGLAVSSELEVRGLRIRSGTLAARGQASAAGATRLWGFTELELDERKLGLDIVMAERGAPLTRLLPEGALAVVNGGYFEVDFKPSTWLKRGGIELAKKSDTSKGGVLALRGNEVYVGPFTALPFDPALAVQSFPLIVEPDAKPGIRSDDGRRAARTVACLVGERLHFIVITAPRGEGPTLFESASILGEPAPHGFACRVALNLDGGPSSGVWFAPDVPAKQRPPVAPVGYAIAVVPRAL